MKISTNDQLREQGLDDIANLDIGFVMPRLLKGKLVMTVGQSRLASRAARGSEKVSVTLNRYYVVESNGRVWPVEIGRLRGDNEAGHVLPPLGGPRLPITAIENIQGDFAMKLDVGERALVRQDGLTAIQEVYPMLGWKATFERVTIHYNVKAAPLATLLLVRRTA